MVEAVKSVLLESITPLGFDRFVSTLDRSLPDAEYGRQEKMRAEAAKLLEDGLHSSPRWRTRSRVTTL